MLVLLLVGAAVVLYRSFAGATGDTADSARDSDESRSSDPAHVDLAAVGSAAGRTADRLERSGVGANEVYRAWTAMTSHFRIANRRSRTPGEFAAAAERAGMEGTDVRELTELFESVRYGDREPSEADEDRAVRLLRRIESRYAGDSE